MTIEVEKYTDTMRKCGINTAKFTWGELEVIAKAMETYARQKQMSYDEQVSDDEIEESAVSFSDDAFVIECFISGAKWMRDEFFEKWKSRQIDRLINKQVSDKESDSALSTQVGGTHYKDFKIQPIEFFIANGTQFAPASIIKYVLRYKDKNGVTDLEKAKHLIDILIEDYERSI
jgi:hypothetical protein